MKISEVSEKFALSQDTLRYYERIGLISKIARDKSGIRNYTDKDCKWIEFVKCMRNAGLSIEVLIEYLELLQQGDLTINSRKELLAKQREQLVDRMKDMQSTLDRLDYKIGVFEGKKLL